MIYIHTNLCISTMPATTYRILIILTRITIVARIGHSSCKQNNILDYILICDTLQKCVCIRQAGRNGSCCARGIKIIDLVLQRIKIICKIGHGCTRILIRDNSYIIVSGCLANVVQEARRRLLYILNCSICSINLFTTGSDKCR